MKELSKIEELFLLTIWHLKDNAYGVTIRNKIIENYGKKYTYGTIYAQLERLLIKMYVNKHEGKPQKERGGRRKLMYKLTPLGFHALKEAYENQRTVWGDITSSALDAEINK